MTWQDYIAPDPQVLAGKPVVRGTRLAVDFLLGLFATGWSVEALRRTCLSRRRVGSAWGRLLTSRPGRTVGSRSHRRGASGNGRNGVRRLLHGGRTGSRPPAAAAVERRPEWYTKSYTPVPHFQSFCCRSTPLFSFLATDSSAARFGLSVARTMIHRMVHSAAGCSPRSLSCATDRARLLRTERAREPSTRWIH